MMFLLLLLLLPVIATSNNFGYDPSGSCNPGPSRRGRAQLLADIPCDLTVQGYCNLPGTAYPWYAMRRFVHENQGLVRRMYGDIRHITILKAEFENNEIEVDDIEVAAARYSRDGGKERPPARGRVDRKSKYVYSDFSNGRLNEVLTEPHFRPTSTSTSTTTTTTTSTSTTTPSTTTASTTTTTAAHHDDVAVTSERKPAHKSQKASTPTLSYTEEVENLKNKYILLDINDEAEEPLILGEESVETNSVYENTTEGQEPVTQSSLKFVKLSDSILNQDNGHISSTLKIVRPHAKGDDGSPSSTAPTVLVHQPEPIDPLRDDIIVENDDNYRGYERSEATPLASSTVSSKKNDQPLDRIDDFSDESLEFIDAKDPPVFDQKKSTLNSQQQTPVQQQTHQGHTMEGHLFQDAVQKNAQPPIMTGRGV